MLDFVYLKVYYMIIIDFKFTDLMADLKNDVNVQQNIVQPISVAEKQVTSKLDGKYVTIVQ